jgi:hypothetical protein
MQVKGSFLHLSWEEAAEVKAILASGLPVVDPLGPSQVAKVRRLLGEATWRDLRLAPKHLLPDLLGLGLVIDW